MHFFSQGTTQKNYTVDYTIKMSYEVPDHYRLRLVPKNLLHRCSRRDNDNGLH